MMTDEDVQDAKRRLDHALANAPAEVGIAFGVDLYVEFGRRNWLPLRKFSVNGQGAFEIELPTYQSRYAFASWGLGLDEFKVGSRP